MKAKRSLIFFTIIIYLFAGCKKNDTIIFSSEKSIIAFVLLTSDNPALTEDVSGIIAGDTIRLNLPSGTVITNLKPDIKHTGVGILPGSLTAQDFNKPVTYKVSAEDGSVKTYTVVVRYRSTSKEITSFILKASDNNILKTDVIGSIGLDTIELQLPPGTSLLNLVPTITHSGKLLSPSNQAAQDFSKPLQYTVQAEDGSYKTYTVMAGMNATVYVGSKDGFLYAINATTGRLKWRYGTNEAIYSSPTVQDGVVYVGSTDKYLYAIDATTGKLKWKTYLQRSITSSPTVSEGVVFITNYSAYAINAATGNILWSTASFNYDLYSPTVANGKLYFGGFVGGLLCLDAATGRQIWNANTGIMRSNPALHNGVVYVGGEGAKIMSFDALTGTQKWAYMNGGFGSPGSATGNEQSVFIGAYDSKLYSFDKSTGAVQWSLPSLGVSIGNGGLFYSPVAANGMVYSANSDKVVYAVDAATGTLNWKFGVYDSNGSSSFAEISNVTFANGVLFTGNPDGNLYALDANTGFVKWKFTTNGAVYSGACVLDAKGDIFHPGISGDQQ